MNREIKFRAWDGEVMFVPLYVERYGYVVRKFGAPCERAILMQYTGLKDKNGKEIYDGDVVSVPYVNPKGRVTDDELRKSAVVMRHGSFGLQHTDFFPLLNWCETSEGEYVSNYGHKVIVGPCVLTVMGNIYETPDLLKA